MQIPYIKLDPALTDPSIAHTGDAGFDLCAREETALSPGDYAAISTGMIFEIPDGYVGLIWDKSGLSTKHALKVLGGVIDAGYRGEVKVGMINLGKEQYTFKKGEKVAQMLIQKVEILTFSATEKLSKTSREADGFGSTGK